MTDKVDESMIGPYVRQSVEEAYKEGYSRGHTDGGEEQRREFAKAHRVAVLGKNAVENIPKIFHPRPPDSPV